MTEIDWQQVFFQLHDVLLARARKRFGATPDAESAYNYALEKLSANGFERVAASYSGSGSSEGFVVVTFVNLMHDYAMTKYGRPRPPAWLKRLGSLWVRAFEMLCLRRLLPETIVDTLTARNEIGRDEVRRMLVEVRARIPQCGQLAASEMTTERQPEEADGSDTGHALEVAEWASLLGALNNALRPDADTVEPGTAPTAAVAESLAELSARFALSGEERLLLRLIYERGYSVSAAARALQMADHNARRLHGRLLRRLRAALDECGLTPFDTATGESS